MALLKARPTLFGVDADYWRIVQSNIDWASRRCFIALAGYVNQAARDDEKTPIAQEGFELAGDYFPFSGPGDPRPVAEAVSSIYTGLKQLPEWAGALDV